MENPSLLFLFYKGTLKEESEVAFLLSGTHQQAFGTSLPAEESNLG